MDKVYEANLSPGMKIIEFIIFIIIFEIFVFNLR